MALQRIAREPQHHRRPRERPRRRGQPAQPEYTADRQRRGEQDPQPDHAASSASSLPRRTRQNASHPPTARNSSRTSHTNAVAPPNGASSPTPFAQLATRTALFSPRLSSRPTLQAPSFSLSTRDGAPHHA